MKNVLAAIAICLSCGVMATPTVYSGDLMLKFDVDPSGKFTRSNLPLLFVDMDECMEGSYAEDATAQKDYPEEKKTLMMYRQCAPGTIMVNVRINKRSLCVLTETFEVLPNGNLNYKKIRAGCQKPLDTLNVIAYGELKKK